MFFNKIKIKKIKSKSFVLGIIDNLNKIILNNLNQFLSLFIQNVASQSNRRSAEPVHPLTSTHIFSGWTIFFEKNIKILIKNVGFINIKILN